MLITLLAVFVLDLVVDAVGRVWWGGDVERWQEREQRPGVKEWMREKSGEGGYGIVDWAGFADSGRSG